MELERQKTKLSLEEFLGTSQHTGENTVGIINETKHWIYRRALDYLTIGFATDVDQIEHTKDQRYELYLATIKQDIHTYASDVQKWNEEHVLNTIPSVWQKEYYDDVRRNDLPSIEVCRDAVVVGPALQRDPSREELEAFGAEGLSFHYDDALATAKDILESQIQSLTAELVTAPFEHIEKGVKTHDELMDEIRKVNSRLSAVDDISRMQADDGVAMSATSQYRGVPSLDELNFQPTVDSPHTFTDELREMVRPIRRIGDAVLHLINTGQIIVKK